LGQRGIFYELSIGSVEGGKGAVAKGVGRKISRGANEKKTEKQ